MKRKIVVMSVFLSSAVLGQNEKIQCGTQSHVELIAEHPELFVERNELEEFTENFILENSTSSKRTQITIPVVFHVNDPTNPQKVTLAQVQSAITILNEDFNGLNPGFDGIRSEFAAIAANVGITFCLASKDPDGFPTNGITYHYNDYNGREPDNTGSSVKLESVWPPNKYLNIWIVNRPENSVYDSGWAYLPSSWAYSNQIDGIVYNHRYLGYTGSSTVSGPNSWQQEMAHVLTHEIGHYLNLEHTFEGTCSAQNDFVADTPPVYYSAGTSNCNQTDQKCQGVSLVNDENYMDYTDCPLMFTNGQKSRMLAALNSTTAQRKNLWTNANLIAVGCMADNSGLDELENHFTIYPNPTEGIIQIECDQSIPELTIEVRNVLGQSVIEVTEISFQYNKKENLDLTNLPSGCYYIIVKSKNASLIKRVHKS